MAETIKGINVVIGTDTTGLSKALSDVNKRSKDIQSELKQVEKLLKLDPSNTELLAQKQKLLSDAIANTREKLDRLRAVQEQVNEQFARGEISEGQYRAFQREVVKTEQELASLEKRLESVHPDVQQFGDELEDAGQQAKTAGDRFKEAGDKLKSAGEAMTNAGKKLSVGVTAPIVGLGTVATKAAVDFESAFAGVRKTVDATEEEFAQLEQGIREMSKRMPAAATDIAAVAEAAGQLGIQTDNILKFTETMIGLGEATNLTAEEGATQFARFANIVGMSQNDFDRLGSAVVALGNSLATTEAEIVAMGMRLAGQGAQIGLTEAQIMALAAAMSSVGIEAEAGGTAMSTVLKRMQNAVSLAGEDLEKFAAVARMSATEFAEAFTTDPATALQAFVDGLAASSAAGENLTLILNDLGISGIRESDTLLRLAGASDVLRGAISTATQAWEENTALQNEVAQRYATTESQMAMFKNQLQDVAITLGQALIPALMDMLDAAQPIIDMVADMARWFADLDEGTQKVIIGIAGFAVALGPLLIIVGQLTSGIGAIITAFGGLTAASTAAAAGTAAAGTAAGGAAAGFTALLGPIGLVIAAIAALAAAVYLVIKNWDQIEAFFKDLWGKVSKYLSETWDNITETAKKVWTGLRDWFKQTWESIKERFEGVFKLFGPIVEGAFRHVKIAIETALDVIRNVVKFWQSVFKGDWQGAWDAIKGIVTSIWDGIKRMFTNAKDVMSQIGKNIIQGLVDGIKNMANAAVDAAKNVAKNIGDSVKGFFGISSPSRLMMGFGEDIGEGLAIGIRRSVDEVRRQAAMLSEMAVPSFGKPATPGMAAAGPASSTINMDGLFAGATIVVRNDDDIRQLAREIWSMAAQAQRGLGGVRG